MSHRGKRSWFCESGKDGFKSEDEAYEAIRRQEDPEVKLKVYRCSLCNKFHLSSRR